MDSGVPPLSIAQLTSAPASISARTTVSWPFSAQMSSGVQLLLVRRAAVRAQPQ